MKKMLLSILLLSSLSFSKEYNFDNLLELDGLWTKKFSTEIANGKVYKMYGVNKVYIGQIRNGNMNGEWTDWYESGKKKSEEKYYNGKRIGKRITWYENGQKYSESTYKDGVLNGLTTIWYENGKKANETTWMDGEKIFSKCWDEDGGECECNILNNCISLDVKSLTDFQLVNDYVEAVSQTVALAVEPPEVKELGQFKHPAEIQFFAEPSTITVKHYIPRR